ncbi:MAG TPA: pyridoxal-phosphate dependent enzyme [Gaiellaceae bacterium]
MTTHTLERDHVLERLRENDVVLPTFAELADPATIPSRVREALRSVDPDAPHPLNLFRVHWHNDAARTGFTPVPEHVVLTRELTGVDAKIVVAFGDRFPMIGAHKVLAAYGCLAPRLVAGDFDPTANRAIWPSTGNYCRGGVAISRLLGCRGVAVLPEGMSQERFDWLAQWVVDPEDVIRTPGTESNVKEIYDRCHELELDEANVILNQFGEFGNHVVHYLATGAALERVFASLGDGHRLHSFVSASGSAGTLGAGDYLKERLGALVVAVEAAECPTMLFNGFGEHNIQGIGDKHIPLIHNVMNTDVAVAIHDRATDRLGLLFGREAGVEHLRRRGVPDRILEALPHLGLSSICNVVAAIKVAKQFRLGEEDVIATVATDGAAMYESERRIAEQKFFDGSFDAIAAAEVYGEHLLGTSTELVRELTFEERNRIFNLGYYTWVEQQGVSIDDFEARRRQAFWAEQRAQVAHWDELITEVNARTGVLEAM